MCWEQRNIKPRLMSPTFEVEYPAGGTVLNTSILLQNVA